MNFLVDAQLPIALVRWLKARGHDAAHITDHLPGETPDAEIAAFVAANSFILITKDEDFPTRHAGEGFQLVWLRIGNATNRVLKMWLEDRWDAIEAALADDETIVEVR